MNSIVLHEGRAALATLEEIKETVDQLLEVMESELHRERYSLVFNDAWLGLEELSEELGDDIADDGI